jgi:hypothetical protein
MQTYFAPPERSDAAGLSRDILTISINPLVDGLMTVANGFFAVLNEHRQIVALNEAFLKLMGIDDAWKVLGLRPGEYVNCVHSCEMPGGCGTSPFCASCGAVIAIMAALTDNSPQERTCCVTVEKDNKELELFFQVRCCPVSISGKRFVLLFLHDISIQQQRAYLESTFFHDINNLLTGLMGKSELFQMKGVWDEERFGELKRMIQRMAQEMSIQKTMANSISHCYKPLYSLISVNTLLDEVEETFRNHPLVRDGSFRVSRIVTDSVLVTDQHLVLRILVNMVTNALEATAGGGKVKVFTEPTGNAMSFCVWNSGAISREIALRIFQRNFSTKGELGHGLGTYSMKLFGEKVLGGQVNFTSSDQDGTTFRLTLQQQ